MRILFRRLATLALLAAPLAARAQAPDPSPQTGAIETGAMAQREAALLAFIGGGRLTAAEQQQAADIVSDGLRDDRAAELKLDAGAAKLLARMAQLDPRFLAHVRASARLNAATLTTTVPSLRRELAQEAQIIAAHDPAVVWDASRKRLITRVSVAAMVREDAQAAALFGVPVPGQDAAPALERAIAAGYPGFDDGMKTMLAQAEETLPYALTFLNGAPAQKRAALVAQYRPVILAAPDSGTRLLRLTQVLASAGAAGARQAAGGGSGGGGGLDGALSYQRQQDLLNRKMLGASRSFSPGCNVATGTAQENPGFCNP